MLGKQFLIDFSNQMQTSIDIAFTPPGGEALIDLYEEALPGVVTSPVIFGFHCRNPFQER